MKSKGSAVKKVLGLFFILTVITGIFYPLAVTGISQAVFHGKANGSVIEIDGKQYGSVLLAQQFTGDEYLWGRVMNIDTETYKNEDGEVLMYSAPSNLSPAGEAYEKLIAGRIEKIRASMPEKEGEKIPSDLVTASGSGLDPHISPAAAKFQAERIARERGMDEKEVQKMIDRYTEGKFLGILGEKTVNVLEVNLALDGILKEEKIHG